MRRAGHGAEMVLGDGDGKRICMLYGYCQHGCCSGLIRVCRCTTKVGRPYTMNGSLVFRTAWRLGRPKRQCRRPCLCLSCRDPAAPVASTAPWTCSQCTFLNEPPLLSKCAAGHRLTCPCTSSTWRPVKSGAAAAPAPAPLPAPESVDVHSHSHLAFRLARRIRVACCCSSRRFRVRRRARDNRSGQVR